MKYIKNFKGVNNKFNKNDYVKLKDDYVNGHYIENISKEIFQAKEVSSWDAQKMLYYNLYYLNGSHLAWVKEDDLVKPSEEEIVEIIKQKEFDDRINKYNL